jgi:hypothetical protein
MSGILGAQLVEEDVPGGAVRIALSVPLRTNQPTWSRRNPRARPAEEDPARCLGSSHDSTRAPCPWRAGREVEIPEPGSEQGTIASCMSMDVLRVCPGVAAAIWAMRSARSGQYHDEDRT